ncbi:MAG: hypothetical protein ACUVTZ_01675 [Armatimonadota bacterium]
MSALDTSQLADRLNNVPPDLWLADTSLVDALDAHLVNAHAHHDTNPWGWDAVRVVAELWSCRVGRVGIVAFDSGEYINCVRRLSDHTTRPIPCFVEALILTPAEGEEWNDLPGRAYFQAGPFPSSEDARPLTSELTRLARRRTQYQVQAFKESLDLGFEYEPNWEVLQLRGMTEANLARDIVEAIKSRSPDPGAVWRQVPGLTADPEDPNFARAFRTATMVLDSGPARVPRTPEFYMTTQQFIELSEGRSWYMYVGKEHGVEADRGRLLDRIADLGLVGVCAIPQRNLDTPDHAADFARLLDMLETRRIVTILGTELNAHNQWWCLDFEQEPFARHRKWLDHCWNTVVQPHGGPPR